MAKDLKYAELFEQYKSLLTEKQRQIFYDYYILDLSFGEIAELRGISRQSVNDCLKKVEEQLDETESALHLGEKYARLVEFGEKLRGSGLYEEFSEIIRD